MKYLNNIVRNMQKAIERHQITQVRAAFMDMSDRQLQDIGISRELLKKGNSAHPWRVEAENAADQLTFKPETAEVVAFPQPAKPSNADKPVNPAPRLAA